MANSLDEMDAHQKELVMLNMMAQRIRPSNGSGVMGSSGQFTDSRAPPSSRGGGSNSGDGGSYMVGSSPSASGSVIYDPKDPARPGLSVTHMNLDPSTGALRSRAETVKAGVFQPGHRQPTMTLEEFADREVRKNSLTAIRNPYTGRFFLVWFVHQCDMLFVNFS